ncbi:MAG TPA: PaaI family thioesterase [Neobacillus sp.]
MNEQLHQLLETCIENSSETDLQALTQILQGMQNKIAGKNSTYIDGLLHMERKIDQDTCEITIPINDVLYNNLDIVHGGITATLLDTTMGSLANFHLQKGFGAVTSQMNIHYIAPGIGDKLSCKAEMIHKGSKTMVVSGSVYRGDGKKIAYSTGTFYIIQK